MEPGLSANGRKWAIASPHSTATQIGAAAFEAGGNAIDAALATAVALAVTYPHNCSVGGDLFALLRTPNGEVIAINASGPAPASFSVNEVRRHHQRMPEYGPLPITVPGVVGGWHSMAELGSRFGMARAVEPAIPLAADGVPVSSSLAKAIDEFRQVLSIDTGSAAVFLSDGQPLQRGATLRQPALARALEAIASEGPSSVYGGTLGASWVKCLNEHGSPMSIDDLLSFEPELTPPLAGKFRNLDVLVPPPNSQGFVLLEILAAVQDLGLRTDPFGADASLLAKVFGTSSADRDRFLADPRHVFVPTDSLLGVEHRARRARDVRQGAGPSATPSPPTGDTIALVAADAEGWAVSLIQSVYGAFGSGILDPVTGVLFQNRGACFSLDATSPNVGAGGKRPMHTLMPVLVLDGDRLAAVTGSMGGGGQPQINAMNLFRLIDLELGASDVIAAPRWLLGGGDIDGGSMRIEIEAPAPRRIIEGFARAGFEIVELEKWSEKAGHAQLIDCRGDLFKVASDPRADGMAMAL